MKRNIWSRLGFTLIELLVVVLIIGILAAVAVPQYQKAVEKAHVMTLLSSMKSVALAQELYYLENGTYTPDLAQLDIEMPVLDKIRVFEIGGDALVIANNNRIYLTDNNLALGIFSGATSRVNVGWVLNHNTLNTHWQQKYAYPFPGAYCFADQQDPIGLSVCESMGTFTRENQCSHLDRRPLYRCRGYFINKL